MSIQPERLNARKQGDRKRYCRFPLFLLTLSSVAVVLPTSAPAADTLVKAATVYTASGTAVKPGMVLVSGTKIVKVGKSIAAPKGATVIDLGKGVLLPGLVDANAQVPVTAGISEVTREVAANYSIYMGLDLYQRRFKELRSEGVTSVVIMPGGDSVIGGMACMVKSGGRSRIVDGFAALLLNVCSDPRVGNRARVKPDSIYIRQPTNRMGVVWIVRQTLARAKTTNPAVSYMARLIREKRHIVARSRTAYDMRTLLKIAAEAGFSPTIVGGHEAHKIARLLATQQVPVILSPVSPVAVRAREATEVVANRAALLDREGVKFAFAGGDLLDQARFAVRYGLSKASAIKAITINPAYIMGHASHIGSIEAGKDADLVALTGDPFDLTTRVQWVMVNGQNYGRTVAQRPTRRPPTKRTTPKKKKPTTKKK